MIWKSYAETAARWRVPAGFVVLLVYAWFARPMPPLLLVGALIAFAGIALRAWAAGHLEKNEQLATSGPYAYTRNPLYLGSALAALGFALASSVWWIGFLLATYLVAFYLPVVYEEEAHLANLFPEFQAYAAAVPRFAIRLRSSGDAGNHFRWQTYWKNEEYNALLGYLAGVAVLLWKLR